MYQSTPNNIIDTHRGGKEANMVVQLRSATKKKLSKDTERESCIGRIDAKPSLLSIINDESVISTLQNPSQWVCHVKNCETTMALWICLTCGECVCMKELQKNITTRNRKHIQKETHVQLHYSPKSKKRSRTRPHSLFMELNTTAHRVYW